MRITVLTGGPSGAAFVAALRDRLASRPGSAPHLVVVTSTGDDVTLHGLRMCPDLDAVQAALFPGAGTGSGHVVSQTLADLGVEPSWPSPTDHEVAIHLARSQWLARGATLSEVTQRLGERLGVGPGVDVLPMSDAPVETHVVLEGPDGPEAVHVQEWRGPLGAPAPERFLAAGLDQATPAPGMLDAIRGADLVVLAPADPITSLGTMLGLPGVRDALRGTPATVVGVDPFAVTPPAAHLAAMTAALRSAGLEPEGRSVQRLFKDFLDRWVDGVEDELAGAVLGHLPG